MPRTKKVKLNDLNQAHGKDESSEFQPVTLDQIWGDDGNGRYNTMDRDKYYDWIHEITRSELFHHASKLGIVPIDNLSLLRQRLMKEFSKHVSMYRFPANAKNQTTHKLSSEIRKILDEGK